MDYAALNTLYLVSLTLMIALAIAVWRRRSAPGAPALLVQIIGIAIWCFGYGLESASQSLWWKLWGTKVGYIGIVMVPLSWLVFTTRFVRGNMLSIRWIIALSVIPAITLIAVWTNGVDGGFQWNRVELVPPSNLEVTPGPWYWIAYAYSTALYLVGTFSLLTGLRHPTRLMRRQTRVLLTAAVIPWAANLLYMSGRSPWPNIDLAPFAFGLAALLVAWSLLWMGFLDLVPIARGIAVEQMRDGWIVVDHLGRVIDLNPTAERFLERTTGGVDGMPLEAVLPEATAALSLGTRRLNGLECRNLEIARGEGPDKRWYELRAWPLDDHAGHVVGNLIVMQDRTERIRTARSLAHARDLAQAADRTKSEFLATMSHEIRTPIHGILGMTDILLDTELQPEQRDCAERARGATLNLLTIINDILDFSKIEAGKLELAHQPFELRSLVEDTVDLIASAASAKEIALSAKIQPDVPRRIVGDGGRVRQILLNLLSNAVKFTDAGRVTVEVSVHAPGTTGECVHFEVADTGVGIPKAAHEKLFESFSQIDGPSANHHGGTGLGLSIVKRLVEQMGGEVGFSSVIGQGSQFRFGLPLHLPVDGTTS